MLDVIAPVSEADTGVLPEPNVVLEVGHAPVITHRDTHLARSSMRLATDDSGSVLSSLGSTNQVCLDDQRQEITWELAVRPEGAGTLRSAERQTQCEASHGLPQQIARCLEVVAEPHQLVHSRSDHRVPPLGLLR